MSGTIGDRVYGVPPEKTDLDRRLYQRSLFDAFIDSLDVNPDAPAIEDQQREPISRRRLMLASCVLGRRLAALTRKGENVGVMLPNVNGVAVTLFALTAYGRTPALINFSAGYKNIEAAVIVAGIKTVVTSELFIKTLKLEELVERLSEKVRIVYLEKVRKELTLVDKVIGAAYAKLPRVFHGLYRRKPDDVAAVLFTSGTEGLPKGVALSSANLLANIGQVTHLYTFVPGDVMFNALPVFHSYGLTAGLLLPLIANFRSFLYPSPLHYKQIPALVRETGSSVLIATDTFAGGWARSAEDEDFKGVKLTILGAERVKDQTRALWMDRFGVVLNEGYGATECAPVVCCNYPGAFKPGSVGCLLPGMEARLEPIQGLDDGGRLFLRGPNVMIGYFKADQPGVLQRGEPGGWYDTGDIAVIDEQGFLFIRGRAKRFAKIGGEMVSLAAVEAYAAALWPETSHAVVSVPDARKGEALVLVTDSGEASVDALLAYAQAHGVPELSIPRKIVKTYSLPVLGTGKMDLVAIELMARST
ncbi:AMP-binding protein [Oryzibacter oryziterrae]|uniref:AMP-binding protein n=1 Tax=Oryzibacter oryziterrae TaxID=2766474 RepID=UPI001F27869E|nr:AMP-binding protein [Oryzibacter oryziterrae]